MGALAPDGARRTCSSSDTGTAASEHPSATAPTYHLPGWCGVTRAQGQVPPKPCQLGGTITSPEHPSHPGEPALLPAAAPGAPWPRPRREEPTDHLVRPHRAVGLTWCREPPRSHAKSPKAGCQITASHVYFKEEAYPPEAPQSQHQGPEALWGGYKLPHPSCHRPWGSAAPLEQEKSLVKHLPVPKGTPNLPALWGWSCCHGRHTPGCWGCPGSSPISQRPKPGFPCRKPSSSSRGPPECHSPALPPCHQPGLALLPRAELVSLWPFRGG